MSQYQRRMLCEPAALARGTGFQAAKPPFDSRRHDHAPTVSVCIVNWNCRELLRACLQSLLKQTNGLSVEVIVVDNASSDGAAEMVVGEFPHVYLIRNLQNAGFARANNQAARLTRGRFLFFLNNDTVVPTQALADLVAYLQAHPEAVIVGPRLCDGAGRTQLSYRRRPTIGTFLHRTVLLRWTGVFRSNYHAYRRSDEDAVARNELCSAQPVDILMGAALLVRREDFLRLGGWDEDFAFGGEDLDLCHRASQLGQVVYLPHVELIHFGRTSTRQNITFASTQIAIGFTKFFRKSGASPAALFAYKLAVTLDCPLQVFVKATQYLWRRLRGRSRQAEQSRQVLRGHLAFCCKGLRRFWQA